MTNYEYQIVAAFKEDDQAGTRTLFYYVIKLNKDEELDYDIVDRFESFDEAKKLYDELEAKKA